MNLPPWYLDELIDTATIISGERARGQFLVWLWPGGHATRALSADDSDRHSAKNSRCVYVEHLCISSCGGGKGCGGRPPAAARAKAAPPTPRFFRAGGGGRPPPCEMGRRRPAAGARPPRAPPAP